MFAIDPRALAAVPHPDIELSPAIRRGIADSVAYLDSDAALDSLAVDPYWPKWHSPWWHMLLLHELGESRQIPRRPVAAMVAALDRVPLHIFPIDPADAPPGTDVYRDIICHCALGSMVPVLTACGVDVGQALPWVRPWFARYQMADGGLSCDEQAYRCEDECPSSMVGTIAPFEAMLPRAQTEADRRFVEQAAAFLIGRQLAHGSPTRYNASERDVAPSWQKLAFPRFYFYDVLRGLRALTAWAEQTGAVLPASAVAAVTNALLDRFPDGVVRVERHAHAGRQTVLPTRDRSPSPRAAAASFPLLDAVGILGAPSAALTRQWSETRRGLLRLLDAGRVV